VFGYLKDLPVPQPIECAVPDEAVGDVMCLLEFLNCFKSLFDFDLPPELSFGKGIASLIFIFMTSSIWSISSTNCKKVFILAVTWFIVF